MVRAACAFAIVVAIVVAFTSSVNAAATQTTVILFEPWSDGALRHDLAVSAKIAGACWTHSLASSRPDAWRCMAGNDIYDPCFSDPHNAHAVACASGPFSRNVALMTLTKSLPTSANEFKLTGELQGLRLSGAPWGLRLVDGQTCEYMSGATDVVAGMRINYACSKRWGVGLPSHSTAIWSLFQADSPTDKHLKKVGVATAIF